ncbi:MAG: GntR family transcriptional regulator [Armatimonadetes bacterium]|nr:GntR family transcriptional regulator [Armatimonadota bacterium]
MSDNSPMVHAIVHEMRSRIERGTYGAGRSLPSERSLATELHVSRLVVRQAIQELDQLGLISCKPNCRPVVKGAWVRTRKNQSGPKHVFIWLWPNTAYFTAASILKGIQSVDIPSDVRLVVGSASNSPDFEDCLAGEHKFLLDVAKDSHAAGVILWYLGAERNSKALEEVRAAGIPMVFVDRLPPASLEGDFVGTDNLSASQAGVKHLVDLGHNRIAYVTNQDLASTVRDREAGYRRALKAGRIPFDPDLVCRGRTDEPAEVAALVDSLLALSSPPTAIVGVNDQIALQVYEALQNRRVSVPRDMSVLGFDGSLRWVAGGGNLTSCCQQFERIGELAVELLLQKMEGGSSTSFRHMLLEAPLADCGSTDKPRQTLEIKPFVYSEKLI